MFYNNQDYIINNLQYITNINKYIICKVTNFNEINYLLVKYTLHHFLNDSNFLLSFIDF